jgi:soluble lytic murein transglycosylase
MLVIFIACSVVSVFPVDIAYSAIRGTPKHKPILNDAMIRRTHAQELMGKFYRKSIVNIGDPVNFEKHIYELVCNSLNQHWKSSANKITQAILEQSRKHHFDPVFLLAVIANESDFNPAAIGTSGEIGLMQIKADTAEWISKKCGLSWKGKKSLYNPMTNIEIGSTYLSMLREKFNSESQLYLAAYNMGSANVYRIIGQKSVPQIYPRRVIKRYLQFYSQINATYSI